MVNNEKQSEENANKKVVNATNLFFATHVLLFVTPCIIIDFKLAENLWKDEHYTKQLVSCSLYKTENIS